MSSNTNAFAQGSVLRVAYAMVAITSVVVVTRVAVQVQKMKKLSVSDYFVFAAFACHITMCALYIAVSPYMKRVYDVINGKSPLYAELPQDSEIMTKMIFAAPCMFWMTLWSIKLSLLFLYRRLLVGINRLYTIVWWILLGFVILTHVGNYVLYFRSCGTIPGFWNGGCGGASAHKAQLASLYYSFSADTSTNIMIMALPIHLTWSLQMPKGKKMGILLLFASGVVCIIFSVLRVAQVATNASKPEAKEEPLDPTWLAIWGMVECSIAVIIGNGPAFAMLVNAFRSKSKAYSAQGYRNQIASKSGAQSGFNLGTMASVKAHDKLDWDAHSSQEELAAAHDGILVTTTIAAAKTPCDGTGKEQRCEF